LDGKTIISNPGFVVGADLGVEWRMKKVVRVPGTIEAALLSLVHGL
jgi:hypothetical protein